MPRFAIIENNTVVNVAAAAAAGDLHLAAGQSTMSSDAAGIGWRLVDGVLVAPQAAPAVPTKAQLAAYADSKATAVLATPAPRAVGGGLAVLADATQGTIADLMALQQWGAANPAATMGWVANDGSVTPITGTQAVALANVVGPFRLAVFATLGGVLSAINAGAITTLAEIDGAAWPSIA